MKSLDRLFAFLLILFCSQYAFTQNITVSGELTDLEGNLIGAATPVLTDVVVTMFETDQSGSPLYTETFLTENNQGISVLGGIFTLILGQGTASGDIAALFGTYDNLWIQIAINGDVLSRAPFTGSAYKIPAPVAMQAEVTN